MRSKYGNRAVTEGSLRFDSKAEHTRYRQLVLAQYSGSISRLMVHPSFVILDAFVDCDGKRNRAATYEADFAYIEDGRFVVEDVKGVITAVFKLKWKMLKSRYPEYKCVIIHVKDL